MYTNNEGADKSGFALDGGMDSRMDSGSSSTVPEGHPFHPLANGFSGL